MSRKAETPRTIEVPGKEGYYMKEFNPDYRNVLEAARNIKPKRMPLYEHIISIEIMEKILNKSFGTLLDGNKSDKREFFRNYNGFFKSMGYDTVSFEMCIGQVMPGSGALGGHVPGVIRDMKDFLQYPWDEIPDLYIRKNFDTFRIMGEMLPEGMKAIGGPGNGVFELVQDVVGYENLCIISFEDPELYSCLFSKVADMMYKIWEVFLKEFGDIYSVCRFGDDLGFKTSTLIKPDDIKKNIIPQYKRLVELIHSYKKPFLLHSCGNIFNVMDDIIETAKIDSKHSNEDQIAPFSTWVNRYGDRIGNFGGVDMDNLCSKSEQQIKEIVKEVVEHSIDHGGFALGSGNSIPNYVPVEGYLAMIEAARELRRE